MKKKMLSLVLLTALCLTLLPVSAFAAYDPWHYYFTQRGSHWGSGPCTTAYPKIQFTITNNLKSVAFRIQKLSGGSWVGVGNWGSVGVGTTTISVPVDSSSTQYRLYVENDWIVGGGESGTVSCKGIW